MKKSFLPTDSSEITPLADNAGLETPFLHQVLDSLRNLNRDFLVTRRLKDYPILDTTTILIIPSDEFYSIPQTNNLVFKNYYDRKIYANNANVHGIPLPVVSDSSMNQIPIEQRTVDVGFIGQINPRPAFIAEMQHVLTSPQNFVADFVTYHGFKNGLSSEDYANRLKNCKISLCPKGVSVETFRYTESLKNGCLIVSEQQPDAWYYDSTPAIVTKDWRLLKSLLNKLPLPVERLKELSEKSYQHYQNNFSVEAVSNYMRKVITQ